MSRRARILAPPLVIGFALLVAVGLIATRSRVEPASNPPAPPTVRVIPAVPTDIVLRIRSQGTVVPRTEIALVPEISGRVVWVAASLVAGGFFAADEPLLRIDPRDYEAAVARAKARLQQAEADVTYARQQLARQAGLAKRQVNSDAAMEDAQHRTRSADAALAEARVALGDAERALERSELRAPFSGRVREEQVDVGQFVSPGASIATIFATDYVEIHLPIPDAELAFLELPLWQPSGVSDSAGPAVRISAHFAGRSHQWTGRVVRTRGEIDARSRMVHVVAQIERPYERSDSPDRVPLSVGLFVNAEIEAATATNVLAVPRSALRDGSKLLVVDAESRLYLRAAETVRLERDRALVRVDLAPGDRVCVSPFEVVVNGMRVVAVEIDPDAAFGRRAPS